MTAVNAILSALFGVSTPFIPGTFGARRRASKSVAGRKRTWSTPHIGAKEQERAKRCYMSHAHDSGYPRSAPTLCQMSKREYDRFGVPR